MRPIVGLFGSAVMLAAGCVDLSVPRVQCADGICEMGPDAASQDGLDRTADAWPPSDGPRFEAGSTCRSGLDCVSGACEDGVCCATACTGSCRSCNLAGSAGTCALVPAGADPRNTCEDTGAAGCGQDGSCNGAGGCRLYPTGTSCAAAACTGSVFTGARTCNGSGSCAGPASVSCGKYQCGTDSCRSTCTLGTHCVSPSVCGAGACGGLKGQYYDNIDFTNLRLTRVDPVITHSLPDDSRAGVGSPDPSIGSDTFSVRWSGTVTPPGSGSYIFYTRSDDRVRLILDGSVIINNQTNHEAVQDSATVTLVGNRAYSIVLEWSENTQLAVIQLLWSSAANGINMQLIPAAFTTPAP